MKKILFGSILTIFICITIATVLYISKSSVNKNNSNDTTMRSSTADQTNNTQDENENEIANDDNIPETENDMTATENNQDEQVIPNNNDFVNVKEYIPDIIIDLKYSTTDNFSQEIIYDFSDAYLRYGTIKKLQDVQKEVGEKGYSLKIWDAYRPVESQFKLWEICPDPTYVSNPNEGFSSHSRGNTVDITLVDLGGNELEMPTGFDDFSKLADRDYSDCNDTARENAEYLEKIMMGCGFKGYSGEWWHFSDQEVYPVEKEFLPWKESNQ